MNAFKILYASYLFKNANLNMSNIAWINMYKVAFFLHTSHEVTSNVSIIKR